MPNHVANKVFFECSDEKAKEIKTAVMYDPNPDDEEYTGFGTFDFNKLIPMHPALMIECGSETENGISLYLTAINPDTPDYDLPKMPRDQFYELLGRLNSERMYTRYNGNLSAEEIEKYTKYSSFGKLADLGKQAVDNLINYSATTWYDWCINNWGTKWNSYDPWKGEDHGLMFSTAWSAPHPVIEELSAHFPGVYFTHEWADEDMGSNCGRREYLNGECVGEYVPESETESLEFACSVWGDSPEDYGMVKSADGTSYVRTDCDSYDVVELFGKPALFANERLSESKDSCQSARADITLLKSSLSAFCRRHLSQISIRSTTQAKPTRTASISARTDMARTSSLISTVEMMTRPTAISSSSATPVRANHTL